MEVFCKDAELTRACCDIGVPACGVNWFSSTKSAALHVQLDLSAGWAQQLLLDTASCMTNTYLFWIAPPCGSFSKARNRPIPDEWRKMGVPEAPQLRSVRHPWGTPQALQKPELASKIHEANKLAEFTFKLVKAAHEHGQPWAVVNPEGSFLWQLADWQGLDYCEWSFHACQFGGSRPFPRTVRCSSPMWDELGRRGKCDGRHTHTPWKPTFGAEGFRGFASRKDAALPEKFCQAMATRIKNEFCAQLPPPLKLASTFEVMATVQAAAGDENRRRSALDAAAVGKQVRGRKLQQMISEHKEVVSATVAASVDTTKRRRLAKLEDVTGRLYPDGTQVLEDAKGESSCTKQVCLGIPWTKLEFLEQAKKLQHPFCSAPVPSWPESAVFDCITAGPERIAMKREEWFTRWEARARQLDPAEDALAKSLHPDIRKWARLKRPLLLREILKATDFPSADLLFEMSTQGFPMFGEFPETQVFPKRDHAASLTIEEALRAAKWARPATAARKKGAWAPEIEEELRKATRDELRRGECRGPFTAEQMNKRHPAGWVDGPRIPVLQKKGVRPCEHYSAYGQNGTSSARETVDTDGIDRILALIKVWSRWLATEGPIEVVLPDGSRREGRRHPAFGPREARELLGWIVDLKRAYKQLARAQKDANLSIFSLPGKDGGPPEYYEALVLGFGSRNAVLGFNFAARAIRHIANMALSLAVTHFFDDFTQIDPRPMAHHSAATLRRLLRLLGWTYKAEPKDLKDPAPGFEPLGVSIDLGETGFASVANTERRVEAILQEAKRLDGANSIGQPDIAAFVGVCQYMEAQTAGRSGALAMRNVRRAAAMRGQAGLEKLKQAVRILGAHVSRTAPRRVDLLSAECPVLIFTDAAAEEAGSSFGAVLFDARSRAMQFCAGKFTARQVKKWQQDVGQQIICQAELAALPIALCTWAELVENRSVLLFVDNDPAKNAAINGVSASQSSSLMVTEMRLLCTSRGIGPWFERVPSPSNIADPPSRGSFDELSSLGAVRVRPVVSAAFEIEFTDYM